MAARLGHDADARVNSGLTDASPVNYKLTHGPRPPLTDLIATVEADAAVADPLTRLATASATAAELTEAGDALVGHFVDACRAAGHTWAEISDVARRHQAGRPQALLGAPRGTCSGSPRGPGRCSSTQRRRRPRPRPRLRRHRAPPARAVPARGHRRRRARRVAASPKTGRRAGGRPRAAPASPGRRSPRSRRSRRRCSAAR